MAAAIALTLHSCMIEDSRNNDMVPDCVSLVYDEPVIEVSVYAGSKDVAVLKSGKGFKGGYAVLTQSADALTRWNSDESNDIQYKQINSSLISLPNNRVDFAASDVRKLVSLSWTPSQVIPVLTDDSFVVPVWIEQSDVDINKDRDYVLLNIVNSAASFASSGSTVMAKETPDQNNEVSIKFKLNHAMPQALTVNYAVDNALVEAYNTEKGTSYIAPPAGYVQVSPAEIPAGATDAFASLTLKTSALFTSGEMMDFRTMVIPLKITGTSVDGVLVSDKVYYLLVNNPLAGASFSRIWGKYSTTALWMAEYDLPSGADRNVATDGTWVYIPYSVGGTTKRITAISVNDPSVTKQVNTEGFVNATITTACVRVIDKGNGQPMLVASGAKEDDFPFYAWENGIDNPPTVFSLQCTWRRGGDRFEFHGTWADGQLYVHAYQGRFATRYKVVDGAFVKMEDGTYNGTDRALVNMLATDTGFGGFYVYPGQDQMVFTTSDVSAFITMKDTYVDPGDGQKAWETAREEFPDADMTWGYRVFTLNGEKYIAYTAIDKLDQLKEDGSTYYTTKQRARLVIVKDKGGFKASLDGDNKDILFEAPLQGEEFEDIAIAPPVSAQGDCSVREYSDHVIIAAGVQGLGVSVFKVE